MRTSPGDVTQTQNPILDRALAFHAAGIVAIPVKADGSKAPDAAWKRWQHEQPSVDQLHQWFGRGAHGLGVVTGAVSGHLEMVELEGRAIGMLGQIQVIAEAAGQGQLFQNICNGYMEGSPSGGIHWLYQVENGGLSGNLKLARRPGANDGIDVLAETRSEGGFVITAPSGGPVHPSGGLWVQMTGGPATIAQITIEERNNFLALFRSLDAMPRVEAIAETITKGSAIGRPGDDYNDRATWEDLLTPFGWTHIHTYGETTYWRRPGKQDGISATTGHGDGDYLYVFSTSTSFESERGYSKFSAYAILNHGGDITNAARQLGRDGYGDQLAPHGDLSPWTPDYVAAADAGLSVEQIRAAYLHDIAPTIDWASFWTEEDDTEWLIDTFLPARRGVALYSAPKVGKSLLLLEIAAGLSTGREILGKINPVRDVLYIDFENDRLGDIRPRLEAMGYGPDDDLSRLHYASLPTLKTLDTDMGGVELLALATMHSAELVVIDTVSRAISGEENENDTWLHFFRHTGYRLKQAGIAYIRLDHSGKDETKGQRGGSAKSGDVDLIWRLSLVGEDSLTLTCDASRIYLSERHKTLQRHRDPLHHTVESRSAAAVKTDAAKDWIRSHPGYTNNETAHAGYVQDVVGAVGAKTFRAIWKDCKNDLLPYENE